MDMRYFKVLYKELNSSFDTEGGTFHYSDEKVSPRDVKRLSDVFRLLVAVSFDIWDNNPKSAGFNQMFAAIKWLWIVLRSGGCVDYLFELLKKFTAHLRSAKGLLTYKLTAEEYGGLGAAVLDIILPLLHARNTPEGFRKLHWLLTFPAKVGFSRQTLIDAGRSSWYDHELWLRTRVNAAWISDSDRLRDIITNWLSGWSPTLMTRGYYTSGSTADAGRDISEKLKSRCVTVELAELAVRTTPWLCDLAPLVIDPKLIPCSRWVQVPKNALTLREISMEPAALNWWQVALDDSLREAISHSPLHRIYNPEDQVSSRIDAIDGSRSGYLATIDLSKASDCVRPDHVRAWFPQLLQRWLFATRSPLADVDGDIVFLEKFAPMGSRLTFDIESIIFSALGWLAEEKAGIPKEFRRLRVYGDDTVIEASAVPFFFELLLSYGFIPNQDKSYWTGMFREACGAFAYNGLDITMPAMPRKPFSPFDEADSRTIAWLSTLANNAYYSNAMMLRYYCVATILEYGNPKFHPPSLQEATELWYGQPEKEFRDMSNFSLVSDQPTQWRMLRRRRRRRIAHGAPSNSSFPKLPSRPDYGWGECLALTPQESITERDDDAAYQVWLYEASLRKESDGLCPEDLITCRNREQHALLPRERWVAIPG